MLLPPVEFSPYTSIRFTEHLLMEGIAPSIGTVGDGFDDALMEAIIGLFKTECMATTSSMTAVQDHRNVQYAAMGMGEPVQQPQIRRRASARGQTGLGHPEVPCDLSD